MKLNTAIIAHSLADETDFICGGTDDGLIFRQVRFILNESQKYTADTLYFAQWEKLKLFSSCPGYLVCNGGGSEAAEFFRRLGLKGLIIGNRDPLTVFDKIQEIFDRYNQLEAKLIAAISHKSPMRVILNCIADLFQNHALLFDTEHNLIDYSDHFMPDEDDRFWKEVFETGKRSSTMLAMSRTNGNQAETIKSQHAEFVNIGPGIPQFMTRSFFERGRRLATLMIVESKKPLSASQLAVFEEVSNLLLPNLFNRFSPSLSFAESVRSVFKDMLDQTDADPRVIAKCLKLGGWSADDNFCLLLVDMPAERRGPEDLIQSRYAYQRLFPDCIAFDYIDSLVILVHNDTKEAMAASLPRLERQLGQDNAVCGVSLPFSTVEQLGAHHKCARAAISLGDRSKKIRYFGEVMTKHVVSGLGGKMPLVPLCHREAVRILKYDRENGTELLTTLETYLRQDKSQKAAAEELYIHRSTLAYRLGCIEKISKLDLGDSRERLHLLLSCIVLRSLEYQ